MLRRGNAYFSPKKASLNISRVSYLHGPVLEGRELASGTVKPSKDGVQRQSMPVVVVTVIN